MIGQKTVISRSYFLLVYNCLKYIANLSNPKANEIIVGKSVYFLLN